MRSFRDVIGKRGSDHRLMESDGPPDELELGAGVRSEIGRLAHHPRQEARGLTAEADEGEIGATPFITAARVGAVLAVVFVVILVLALLAYYLSG
jgi:hypothetical protein